MRRTSVTTYNAIIQSGALSAKRMAVYDYLYKNGPLTGGQLQKALGGGVSESIRNRVTELVKMGAVYEVKETKCPVTGRNVLLFDVSGNMPKEYEKPKGKNDIIRELKEEIEFLSKVRKGQEAMINKIIEENNSLKFRDCSKETLDMLIEKYPTALISLKMFRRELYGE